jgi:protein N-terminal amidase
MRIACLQFSPQLGKVDENIARADLLLQPYGPDAFDVLVLPEMAFSGGSHTAFSSLHMSQLVVFLK